MTVGELILTLMKHDSEHRVIVQGYEEGLDDVQPPRMVSIELDVHPESWNGRMIQPPAACRPCISPAGVGVADRCHILSASTKSWRHGRPARSPTAVHCDCSVST